MKKTARSARFIALEILCSWEESRLPLDRLMEHCIGSATLQDSRDRQFIMSLVYGVMRWRGYLDWIIANFSSHPLPKIRNRTLQALRAGIFQLLFMDRVPVSAAINETVQALKDMKQPKWLLGFVNGLLRSVERERRKIPDPFTEKNMGAIPEAARLSHPEWLVKRWKKRYGDRQTAEICRANNSQAPLCLRVNTGLTTPAELREKLKNAGLAVEAGKYSPQALKLPGFHGPVATVPGFAEGLFQVQDEAAQLVSLLFGPLQQGVSYLDGCAGLGGKTSHLAEMLPAAGSLVAVEPDSSRISKLRENLGRLRQGGTVTIIEGTLDALLPDRKELFDGILVDVPCSGLGVIRRHPEIRWNREPADLHRYQEKQRALLHQAAQLVAARGTVVYATCSTEPEENEAVVENFLADNPRFELSDCRVALPENCAGLVDDRGFFRTLPGLHDLDGFFGARLAKN